MDYRKDVLCYKDAHKKEMIGKIVVLRYEIKAIEMVNEKVNRVWANIECYLDRFTLFTGSHDNIMDRLADYYQIEDRWVYLRGQIFYDNFHDSISFRPLRNKPFIVGDDIEYIAGAIKGGLTAGMQGKTISLSAEIKKSEKIRNKFYLIHLENCKSDDIITAIVEINNNHLFDIDEHFRPKEGFIANYRGKVFNDNEYGLVLIPDGKLPFNIGK